MEVLALCFGEAVGEVAEAFDCGEVVLGECEDSFSFGLVVLAFWAIFGKLNWKWFAALCTGLAIVAIAGLIIDYVTTDSDSTTPGVRNETSEQAF